MRRETWRMAPDRESCVEEGDRLGEARLTSGGVV